MLDQLSNLYGKTKPSEIAQSLVYGDKPKKENTKPRLTEVSDK